MLSVGVMIATKNRRDDLCRTLLTLAALDPPPAEVLVCADGCTDGTAEMVRADFPAVRLFENPLSRGSVASRDLLIRAATTDLILSLDDDSYPIESDFLARMADLFCRRPKAAVMTFPQRSDEYPESLKRIDWGPPALVGSYTSSGAVLRREVYLRLSGYPGHFHHAYEEPDYSLQCYASGYEVWYEPGLTIRHHYTSVGRNEVGIHHRHARNEQWSAWMRCPMPFLPLVAGYRAIRQLQYAWSRGVGWLVREPVWWSSAVGGLPTCARLRRAEPWPAYWQWLRLSRQPEARSNQE